MTPLQIVLLLLQLFPALIKAIQAAEEAIPTPQAGEDKLAMVKSTLDAFGDNAERIWGYASPVISTVVGVLNKTGVFK